MAKKSAVVPRPVEVADLPAIESWDEVPQFETEREEADFWATHSLGAGLLDQEYEDDPDLPRTRPISVRFDADTIARLQAIAAKKHKGYQTLLKEFVAERLYEEEKREGIIG
jgi:CopG antitoxin of type II toxin-antitoxin system